MFSGVVGNQAPAWSTHPFTRPTRPPAYTVVQQSYIPVAPTVFQSLSIKISGVLRSLASSIRLRGKHVPSQRPLEVEFLNAALAGVAERQQQLPERLHANLGKIVVRPQHRGCHHVHSGATTPGASRATDERTREGELGGGQGDRTTTV